MPTIDKASLYESIGAAIRQARKSYITSSDKVGLSQEELADLLSIKRTSITNIEAGNQTPQVHLIYELCHILQIPLKDILPKTNDVIQNTLSIEEVTLNDRKRLTPNKTASYISNFSSKG